MARPASGSKKKKKRLGNSVKPSNIRKNDTENEHNNQVLDKDVGPSRTKQEPKDIGSNPINLITAQ